MSNYPDFSLHGYQVNQQLGYNHQGGRFTYKATNFSTQQPVVIKQFRFVTDGSDWSSYKAIEREIGVLRSLNHPGIPRYLDSFNSGDGVCLVQEYKDAQSLSIPRSFDRDEIKSIAISILEILVYLQERIPPVIHRDIKPENILVDEQLHVYLVDFGLARVGGNDLAMSSMVAGTVGFMPPEQLLDRPLTEASDLYSLGATLICLLTGTKSNNLGSLVNNSFHINFKPLVPKLNFRMIEWLEKMVDPNLDHRFDNAKATLEALKPLYVTRVPEVELSQSSLEFEASQLGEKLSQTITVDNSIPETVLEGSWEVAPHQNDPPHTPDHHAWISFDPRNFSNNSIQCQIWVDTSKLIANQFYKRQVILHANSSLEKHPITIEVKTASLPIEIIKLPYVSLILLLFTSLAGAAIGATAASIAGAAAATLIGVAVGTGLFAVLFATLGVVIGTVVGIGAVVAALTVAVIGVGGWVGAGALAAIGLWLWLGFGCGWALAVFRDDRGEESNLVENLTNRGFSEVFAVWFSLLTAGFGISLGISLVVGLLNPYAISALAGTGLPLAAMTVYPPLKRNRLIAKYRASQEHLIKP
ncbi:MAG: serine/threonine protein kinase [Cyanobacteria bacterium QH_8_48_120]|jgi:serine/threonine protein kinase|nr:MAG: serine/threonine protein kinase [Cyanobacteria bacterium QH_1_48_107]PSO63229.1 MAG: serine/threonine protein kinase [Cyanobacteria bacterium QH_7_48_89]PSO68678.1 MAG: serine/threonine protein kinase [Cyanobacteria bacterium QH_6_48_35]PSO75723.1 MAG: serine/threonine protein kinase [Cyanobacteria bacterium QH_8_48_120]